MRVVAGSQGGRRLAVPVGRATRPTTELVRGAIFNSLESQGLVDGATVADLFAGSGALGIEALSRGAERAVFVESDRTAARILAANLTALGIADRATVVVTDVGRFVVDGPARYGGLDVALVDPPYGWDGWEGLLAALAMFPTGLVVAESDRTVEVDGWVAVARRHGGTVVSQLRPRGANPT